MAAAARILVTSGSARAASLNRRLARVAAALAREAGAEVTELDLAEGELPAGIAAMNGTVAGLLSASPGVLGGQRGLIFLRALLSMAPGMLVVPQSASIGGAHQAFDEQGALRDAKQQQSVQRVVDAVVKLASA